MGKIDLARRAEIGREKRARTRAQIVEAGLILLAERPPEALTVDAIVEAAGVAKGTFYYHFQSVEELVAAVGAKLADSFDELLAPSRLDEPDPIVRMSLAFTKFLEKAINDPLWGRLVVRSAQVPAGLDRAFAKISRRTLPRRSPRDDWPYRTWSWRPISSSASGFRSRAAVLSGAPRRTSPAKLSTPCCEPLVPPRHDCQRFSLKVLGPSWNVGYGTPVTRSTAAP